MEFGAVSTYLHNVCVCVCVCCRVTGGSETAAAGALNASCSSNRWRKHISRQTGLGCRGYPGVQLLTGTWSWTWTAIPPSPPVSYEVLWPGSEPSSEAARQCSQCNTRTCSIRRCLADDLATIVQIQVLYSPYVPSLTVQNLSHIRQKSPKLASPVAWYSQAGGR